MNTEIVQSAGVEIQLLERADDLITVIQSGFGWAVVAVLVFASVRWAWRKI